MSPSSLLHTLSPLVTAAGRSSMVSRLLHAGQSTKQAPIPTVPALDLARYMGRWHVIANIPTPFERGVYNPVETYALNAKGEIDTLYTYRRGSFDAAQSAVRSTGIVKDRATRATWGVQFVWPFTGEYLVAQVDADYSRAIVARNARDYVWLLAREPQIAAAEYEAFRTQIARLGYDVTKLQKAPQRWPEGAR